VTYNTSAKVTARLPVETFWMLSPTRSAAIQAPTRSRRNRSAVRKPICSLPHRVRRCSRSASRTTCAVNQGDLHGGARADVLAGYDGRERVVNDLTTKEQRAVRTALRCAA
jgi:hypothetical protein